LTVGAAVGWGERSQHNQSNRAVDRSKRLELDKRGDRLRSLLEIVAQAKTPMTNLLKLGTLRLLSYRVFN
jgi:hypothetical protein